ncbi:MAG: ankyrin repeat domain-containing protein [Bacteroidota bacterium]
MVKHSFSKFVFLLLFAFATSIKVQAGPNEDLVTACRQGDLEGVKKAIGAGADVNLKGADGNTPIASAYMWPEITQYLIDQKADPNASNYPALLSATGSSSIDVMRILLNAGADPNKPGIVDVGATMRMLIDKEKAKGKDGNDAMIKAWESALKTAKPTEVYALHSSVMSTNCVACLDLLLAKGAKPEKAVADGNLIHPLANYGKTATERAQMVAAAKPTMESYGLKMPEWYSSLPDDRNGSFEEMLQVLLKKGLNINQKNAAGQTPLSLAYAGGFGNEEVVLILLKNGADLKATGKNNDQTEFASKTESVDDIKVKFDFPREGRNGNGGGYSANMDLLAKKPKRVALISYYLYDPGKGKVKGGSYTGNVSVSVWRTSDFRGQMQVDGFYRNSIDALKTSFKENGIDLLTPNEFLDNDEKKEFYYGFNPETSKKEKVNITKRGAAGTNVWDVATATASTLKISPTGKGYRNFFVGNEAADESTLENYNGGIFTANRKLTSSLGYDLAKALGVDAVMVVYVCTRKVKQTKDDFGVNAVVCMMMGPNPGKAEDTDPEAKNLGQFYCGTRTYYSSPALFREEKGMFGQYEGMGNVMKAHAAKMCRYVNGKEKDE